MRSGLIYLITNTVNGKRYIGQTVGTAAKRWREHKSAALTGQSDTPLHRAIRKHGPDKFTITTVAETYEPFLNEVEKLAIWTYQTHGSVGGYNATPGGDGFGSAEQHSQYGKTGKLSHNYGKPKSPEHRVKMSVARAGKFLGKRRNASSQYMGVSRCTARSNWYASIKIDGKLRGICYKADEIDAAMAVDQYIIEHGLNRPLNFPTPLPMAAWSRAIGTV
jgi:group I intron endonuclease